MKTVAFVPIRLNSQRVPAKNVRPLAGKPLMRHILDTLVGVESIDEVYVYCSSDEVLPLLPTGVTLLHRPTSLDSNDTLGEDIYDAFTHAVDADIYILAHATSPFIRRETISNALQQVMSGKHDSAFACRKIQTFCWFDGQPLNYSLQHIPRTQTIQPVYEETSAFYIFRREVWMQHHQRIGIKPFLAVTDNIESIDIDWPDDFLLAEMIASKEAPAK